MTSLTVAQARTKFYKLLDLTANSHKPVQIRGKRNNAVLIAEEDWKIIQKIIVKQEER